MRFDVIIIGAGPGGGMAAAALAPTGLTVAVLEKEAIPRRKACAGILPAAVEDLLGWPIDPVVEQRIHSARNMYEWRLEKIRDQRPEPLFLTVDRRRFDADVIDHAIRLGHGNVSLLDRFPVRRLHETDRRVTVVGKNGERLSASYVLAADGAFSKAARLLGLQPQRAYGWAVDASVEVDPSTMKREAHRASFQFGCIPGGYGWIAPKKEYLSCGVGTWQKQVRLSGPLSTFLAKSFPEGKFRLLRKQVHPLPLFEGMKKIASRRICLIGDAAGLVDPILGEGIRYAIESGRHAAKAVTDILLKGHPDGKNPPCLAGTYMPAIRKTIGNRLEVLWRLAVPVYRKAPEFFYRKFFMQDASYVAVYEHLAQRIADQRDKRRLEAPP